MVVLAFVASASYRLVDIEAASLSRGDRLTVEGEHHNVARVGPSPLPGDSRRCAYLMRVGGGSPTDGSS